VLERGGSEVAEEGERGSGLLARRARLLIAVLFVTAVAIGAWNAVRLVEQRRAERRYAPERTIVLDAPAAATNKPATQPKRRRTLRVAIAPVISPEESIRIYRGLVKYLAEKLGRQPELIQRESYSQINDLVRYGRCELALVCTYAYVRGQREFGMELLVAPQIHGATTYHSLFIVPAGSRVSSLLELRGKRFASADILSNSGWLYPMVWLKRHGEDPSRFFGEHVITGGHDRSIRAVATGYVDGAAVDSLVYEQLLREEPALAEKTKVIHKSPPFGMPPLVVPPQLDPQLKEQLRSLLLSMHEDARGSKILASLGIDKFVLATDAAYRSVREAAKLVESGW